jgi:hypothetical protein
VHQDAEQLTVEFVDIDSVRPDPHNARIHSERDLEHKRAGLQRFGQRKPIVVDSDGVIRAGNGTWQAAKQLGWRRINIVRSDLPLDEIVLYAIADNRSGDLSFFDDEAVGQLLAPLDGDALLAVGFDVAEADELASEIEDETEPAERRNLGRGATSVRLMVAVSNVEIIERALAATGKINREQALIEVCSAYLGNDAAALAGDAPLTAVAA